MELMEIKSEKSEKQRAVLFVSFPARLFVASGLVSNKNSRIVSLIFASSMANAT